MKRLGQKEAEIIHKIIMQSNNSAFIEAYEKTLTLQAGMRMGMYGQTSAWHGTPLPNEIKEKLGGRFNLQTLHGRNLLSQDASHIELGVLADALPDNIIYPYFKFDPKQCAEESGLEYETFKTELKAAFKGTIGKPGMPDFGILLDASNQGHNFWNYSHLLGLNRLAHPCSKAEADKLTAKGDLPEYFTIYASQGQQVYEKGIDAKTVFLITPESSRLSVQMMAQILNFQGASHYLPNEQKK